MILQPSIHYFECLDTPAAETSTINEGLNGALNIKDHLRISSMCIWSTNQYFAKPGLHMIT